VKIRYGWNTPLGRVKFDVEVDEADLPRILIECGVDVSHAATMSAKDVYRVLYCEALMFSAAAQARQEPESTEALRQEIAERRAERDRVLQPYKPPEPKKAEPEEAEAE
jgi:hypothetical protein